MKTQRSTVYVSLGSRKSLSNDFSEKTRERSFIREDISKENKTHPQRLL